MLTTNVGSPQGAILSPSIFIILIADIGLWCDSNLLGYADDTTASIMGTDIPQLVSKCESEAQKIIDYMSVNRLKANDDKTHVMVIRKNKLKNSEQNLTINVGNQSIEETTSEKLLGVHVENDLTWTHHLTVLERKLKYRLFTLRRLSEKIPKYLLKNVADGIFMSLVRYGLPLLLSNKDGPRTPESQLYTQD